MKLKRLFSILALAIFGVSSIGVGASLLNKTPIETRAEAAKTWMFRAQLNLADASPNKEGNVFGEDAVDMVKFHYWGTGLDKTVEASHMGTDSDWNKDIYGVNISLADSDVISGAQWILHQKTSGDKYSVDLKNFGNLNFSTIDKNTKHSVIEWAYKHEWTSDGHWKVPEGLSTSIDKLNINIKNQTTKFEFVKEPQNNVFAIRNFVYPESELIIENNLGSSIHFQRLFYGLAFRGSGKDVVISGSSNWIRLKEAGTYDFVFRDNSIEIKKYADATDTYVYYVTGGGEATKDYIYSWGGSMQFGAFPGTKITDVAGVKEVTNGVLHFQGGSDKNLIYKIPLQTGYPTGDSMFMFNNGTSEYKSDERAIVSTASYWWTGPANIDATKGLEFLLEAEAIRNAATNYSVCNITSEDARKIVTAYNALSEKVKTTYVDTSSTFTWTSIEMNDNTLVSYKAIVERLALAGGVAVAGSSLINLGFHSNMNTTVTAILAVIVAIGSISAVTLIILKKRKHN